MGQARRRGTRDERVAVVLERQRLAQEARDRAERAELKERSERWAAMSQDERDAALEKAKAEVRTYSELASIFGHDTARVLMAMQ